MATSIVIHDDRFPVGQSVQVYAAAPYGGFAPTGVPGGTLVTTAVVAADGSLTFVTLTDNTLYYAYALVSSVNIYVQFRTTPLPANIQLVPLSRSGVLTATAGTAEFMFPTAATVRGVVIAVGTAPTGANLICDVNKNGTTIFTTQANRPTIAAGNLRSTVEAIPDVTAFAAFDYITVDVDQIGSGTAGSDLTVTVRTGT